MSLAEALYFYQQNYIQNCPKLFRLFFNFLCLLFIYSDSSFCVNRNWNRRKMYRQTQQINATQQN